MTSHLGRRWMDLLFTRFSTLSGLNSNSGLKDSCSLLGRILTEKPWVFSNACVMPVPLGTTEWSLSLLAHCQSLHRALVRLPWLTTYTGHKLNHWSFFESSQEIHRSNHLLLIIYIVWFISYNLKGRKYPIT